MDVGKAGRGRVNMKKKNMLYQTFIELIKILKQENLLGKYAKFLLKLLG